MTDADTTADTITLRLVEHGETTIEVDRAEYEAAKADGELNYYLDLWQYDAVRDTAIIESDGTLIDLRRGVPPRPSLLGRDVTAGVAAIIEQAPAGRDCPDCAPRHRSVCARHIAEHLVETVRHEQLIILPVADADAVLAQAVANATIGRAPRRDMKEN